MNTDWDSDSSDTQGWHHHEELLRQQRVDETIRAFERAREEFWMAQIYRELGARP